MIQGLEIDLVIVVLIVEVVVLEARIVLEAAIDLELAQAAQHVGALAVLPADEGGGGVDLEAVDAGDVALGGLGRHQRRVHLEHDVVERGPEVGAVDGRVPRRLRVVHVLAPRAVQLHGLLVRRVRRAHREERVRAAEHPRALAEVGFLVLVELWKERKGQF